MLKPNDLITLDGKLYRVAKIREGNIVLKLHTGPVFIPQAAATIKDQWFADRQEAAAVQAQRKQFSEMGGKPVISIPHIR